MIGQRRFSGLLIALAAFLLLCDRTAATQEPVLRGAMLCANEVTEQRINQLKATGTTAIVVVLSENTSEGESDLVRTASATVGKSELDLYYWIEVARCPDLADLHPKWMASQQTHPEWRRLFPNAPSPKPNEVVKTYPWVPILSRETFSAQLARVTKLLNRVPPSKGVFLNDLQGGPSACGCGNSLCRWTSDYGKLRTTIPLADDAAALFVDKVARLMPDSNVIPVWTTECEQHDGGKEGLCAGVGCFAGICWKAWTSQLAPIERSCSQLAVLAPYKAFHRDVPFYGDEAAWIGQAVSAFDAMPRKYEHPPVEGSRLITILQGWDVGPVEVDAQIRMAERAGVGGFVVAYCKIDQSWEPRLETFP